MKKNISKPVKKLAVLLLLPAFAGFLAAFAQPEYHYSVLPFQPEVKAPVSQIDVKVTENPQSPVKATDSKPAKTPATGQVLDTDGKPVAGAAILHKESKTDTDGKDEQDKPVEKSDSVIVTKGVYTTCSSDKMYLKLDTVSIRGKNLPLIIVDGKDYTSSLKDINPNNIKSITIFKDESAIAKYGEKGKNGVIIIELKEITEL